MSNLLQKIKICATCIVAFLCTSLLAQGSFMVAVMEPSAAREMPQSQIMLVRNAIMDSVSKNNQFRVMDRARLDKVLEEHDIVRNSFLFAPDQARELGKMLGVDYIFTSELSQLEDALDISCQVLDIVTGEVVASGSALVEERISRKVREGCEDMVNNLLKTLRTKAGNRRGAPAPDEMLTGLDAEIARAIKNFRTNAKWNRIKANSDIEVDLSGVTIQSNAQFGREVFRVSGNMTIILIDENGNEGSTDIAIDDFTEMNSQLMKRKINGQLKLGNIIRDLLDSLDDKQ